ncbi:phage tail tape measure protein [Faecalispora jeddahensis]|uniref:phage tail tape measure protein n=1 Tax=Faecalispora jeddahensis TaxID=1414721 RepID=UPI0028AF5F5D|nr:phage tail tape measure protein [Faecalispora jeddahensis]
MGFDIGPRIGIEGEAEYRKQIQSNITLQKTLATEMQAVTSAFDKNDQSQENLTAQNKVLTKQIEAQKQKLDLLRDGLTAAADKYGENDKVTQGWQQAVNKATADLNKMERQLKDNNDVLDRADTMSDDAADGMKDFGEAVDDAGKKSLSFGDILKANVIGDFIVSGIKKIAGGFKDLATGALDAADSIQQLADQTGMSAEQIQTWQYVGDTLGTSIETITGAQMKLTKNMQSAAKGTKTQAEAFKALGISVTDSNGNLRDAQTVMMEAFGALGRVGNETERNAIAMNIFGKSAADLNPLISAGTDQLADLAKQANDTGAVMSGDTVSALDDFGDTIGQLKQSATAAAGTLLSQFMPSIQSAANAAKNVDLTPVINTTSWIIANGGTLTTVLLIATGAMVAWKTAVAAAAIVQGAHNAQLVIAAIRAEGLAAGQVALTAAQGSTKLATIALSAATVKNTAMTLANNAAQTAAAVASKGATAAQLLLNAAFVATPIGWIVLGFGTLVTAFILLWNKSEEFRQFWYNTWDNIRSTAASATAFIKDNWSYIPLFLLNPVAGALKLLYDKNPQFRAWADAAGQNIKSGFTSAVNWIQSLPDQASAWGRDMIQNFIDGIKEKLSDLKEAASNVGKSIKKMLGHSVPEEGPLKDEMTWMPDMMDNLAKGILNNRHKVTDALYTLASEMKSPVNIPSTISPALATAGGISGALTPVVNYTSNYYSPAAPTPATVNRVNRKNAQQLALIVRR